MVGELKTINVWVDQGLAGRGRWCIVQVISWNLNFSGREFFRTKYPELRYSERESLFVHADAGEVPRDEVACVHAAEVGRLQVLCEHAGVKVVHVLVDPDV
jgi:hypothetical protein